MNKRLLAVFAHPDDEAFGPGGTLAKYAGEGVEIHLLCATRGEAGKNHQLRTKNLGLRTDSDKDTSGVALDDSPEVEELETKIGDIREKELFKSAKILGIKKVVFLDFVDGGLSNAIYHKLADKIIQKIDEFKPQVILTMERLGISGHLDHIAVSMITTFAYLHAQHKANKLYYYCLPRERRDKELDDYFVYFPEGYTQKEITTRIDFTAYWDKKEKAMKTHQSQLHDVRRILKRWQGRPKIDHYILQFHHDIKVKLPETDLFAGIKA